MFKPVHIVHLLIYSPDANNIIRPITGRTRLMKMLFLFEKEISQRFKMDENFNFGFEAFNYGPFSKKIYEAIDFLETINIISIDYSTGLINESDLELEYWLGTQDEEESVFDATNNLLKVEQFSITKLGEAIMKDRRKHFSWVNLSENQKNILIQFKSQMCGARLKDILRYVYEKYPNYAEKSLIRSQFFI